MRNKLKNYESVDYTMDLIENFLKNTAYVFKAENKRYYLRKNNKVKLPRRLNSDLAYLIGFIQGDGHLKTREKRVGLSINNFELLEKINVLINSLFDYTPNMHRKKDKKLLFDVIINSIVVYEFVRINFDLSIGRKKNKLFLPEIIKKSNKSFLAWLAGFIDSDGHITKYASLQIVQSSFKILRDVQEKLCTLYDVKGKIIYNKANDAYYLSYTQKEFCKFKLDVAKFMREKTKVVKMGRPRFELGIPAL